MNVEAVESCAECGRPPEEGVIGWSREAEKFLCAICDGWSRNGDGPDLTGLVEAERESPQKVRGDGELRLEVLTAREVCELPGPPASDELLGPLLIRGQRLVLGGNTGEGKTTMALQMIRAVALGETFLDWNGSGGRALVVDAEQGLRSVQRRLHEAGLAESDQVDYVREPDGLSLDSNAQHVAEVERVLGAGDYSVVLADPLYKLHGGDSNAEREAVDLMRTLDRWREKYRFALVLPMHLRKPPPDAKFSLAEFFGSTAFLRGAEAALGVQRIANGYARLHFLKDRDGDLPIGESWGLLFDREHGFRRDADDGAKKQTAAEQIRELLAEEPGLTEEQLNARTGYAERTIRRALREIGAEPVRRVGSTGQKQFELPSTEELPLDA